MQTHTPSAFRQISPHIYVAETALKIPGSQLPLRTTAVEVSPKKFVVISPMHPKAVDYQSLKNLGEVEAIVAPNAFHHLFVKKAHGYFSQAKLWCAPILKTKRADVPWDFVFAQDSWPYEDVLKFEFVKGTKKIDECVFYHPGDRTLIVTDLIFNLQKPLPFLQTIPYRIMGTWQKFTTSRLMWFLKKDRAALSESLMKIAALDFNTVIVAHGEIETENAKEKFAKAIAPHLI